MKWKVAGLMALGIVAALSAAMLMALLAGRHNISNRAPADSEAAVLVATHDLPASAMIDAASVEVRKVPRDKMPERALATPVEAVGKILKTPVTAGQAFNRDMFVTEGNAQLAGSFPDGKRGFGISVTDFAGLDGVLYPGSVVDVVMTLPPNATYPVPVSRTVLEAVQVLAIDRQTVVAQDSEKQTSIDDRRGKNARRVTLLVTSRQATELSLAQNQGTLALALRNPTDKKAAFDAPVLLTALIPPSENTAESKPPASAKGAADATGSAAGGLPKPADNMPVALAKPIWETTVIRGSTVQTVKFPGESESVNVVKESDP